ncbi:MAG TPA: Gx transporter family protein [bacterium (Candidatus Stahlbacteria)]|nr:Gx transporter family protein [Candidatus Stahlbacteria bacterium]
MVSPGNSSLGNISYDNVERITRISVLTGLAIGIYALETLIPKPLPWLRLGLSNAIVLCVLTIFGLKDALIVSILRTTIGTLIVGTFLTPFFFFGLLGGITSTLVMGFFYYHVRNTFSLIGISIWGALSHNTVQLLLAYSLYVKRVEIFYLVPVFILLAIFTGSLTGTAAIYLRGALEKNLVTVE